MALTESKSVDKIEVDSTGHIGVREALKVYRDGELIATTYHRWMFAPGDDVSAMPQPVQNIASVTWTPEVIEAYNQIKQQNAGTAS